MPGNNQEIKCPRFAVLVLAAGQGKRMHSSEPKVLKPICGKPVLFYILETIARSFPGVSIGLVLGFGREKVQRAVQGKFPKLDISMIDQPTQNGTGDATRCAMESDWGGNLGQSVLVLPGDTPLITPALLTKMMEPLARGKEMRVLSFLAEDPTGYGRIIRRGNTVLKNVEHRDATDKELAVKEVGASIYLFNSKFLKIGLGKLSKKNSQSEYYLTDLINQAAGNQKSKTKKVEVLQWPEAADLQGMNDFWQLSLVEAEVNRRCLKEWARQGVRIQDPSNTYVAPTVTLAPGVEIGAGVHLRGQTSIGKGTVVRAGCIIEDSIVKENCKIGPYAHLRPGSLVGDECKIGNFVELKQSTIGNHTSIAHLSYVGDAHVGNGVNIGCGFVTCNYDGRTKNGRRKHPTLIEDGVFMGSDCQTVAPVRVGRGAYVASGSTITRDVEADALAIARSRQVNKPGMAKRFRDYNGAGAELR